MNLQFPYVRNVAEDASLQPRNVQQRWRSCFRNSDEFRYDFRCAVASLREALLDSDEFRYVVLPSEIAARAWRQAA